VHSVPEDFLNNVCPIIFIAIIFLLATVNHNAEGQKHPVAGKEENNEHSLDFLGAKLKHHHINDNKRL